tara:strand:+ start:162 stop:767 length:606 start_codon:yes stop_codon:yes gene_type:complete
MEQLQNTAGQGNSMGSFDEGESSVEMEEMLQTNSIPGQSLTQDPENPQGYETPPEFTDVQDFIEESFLQLTEPSSLSPLLQAMRGNIPVEHLAEKFLMKAMQAGKITPDLLMLSIEPIIYTMISLATYAKIEPVLYPEDNMIDSEEKDKTDLFKKSSRELLVGEDKDDSGGLTVSEIQAPTSVPRSLLARSKKAVAEVGET